MPRTPLAAVQIATLIAALACTAPARAGTAADETIATASAQAVPATDDTAAQIRQWIAAAPPPSLGDGGVDGVVENAPRQVHGEVGVAVGSGGYRSAYAISTFPIGRTGALTVAVGETRNGRGFGYGGYGPGGYGPGGYGRGTQQSLGISLDMGGSDRDETRCRPRFGGLDGAEPLPPVGWGVRQDCRSGR